MESGCSFLFLKAAIQEAWDEIQSLPQPHSLEALGSVAAALYPRDQPSAIQPLRGDRPHAHITCTRPDDTSAPFGETQCLLTARGLATTAHVPSPTETHLDWAIAQEVQIHVLSKEVTFRVGGVEFLTSHEKVGGKVVSWLKKETQL